MVAVTSGYIAAEARGGVLPENGCRQRGFEILPGGVLPEALRRPIWLPCWRRWSTSGTETDCWLEVTTLLIPGLNDSDAELDELTALGGGASGRGHAAAFQRVPSGRRDAGRAAHARSETLRRARELARQNGLHHVYVGNVARRGGGDDDLLSGLRRALDRTRGIPRGPVGMDADGRCRTCGKVCEGVGNEKRPADVAGRFASRWGRRLERVAGGDAAEEDVHFGIEIARFDVVADVAVEDRAVGALEADGGLFGEGVVQDGVELGMREGGAGVGAVVGLDIVFAGDSRGWRRGRARGRPSGRSCGRWRTGRSSRPGCPGRGRT